MKKIATLGPKGTFSEQAAMKYNGETEITLVKNIPEVFESVNKGETEIGLVPVENMLDGSVDQTLDLLYDNNLKIVEVIYLPIHMCVAGLGTLAQVTTVISHPKALGQVRNLIKRLNLHTMNASSTAAAMKEVSESGDHALGAIGPENAADEYKLKIFEKNIEDNKNNVTRFFVISKEKEERDPEADYQTSLAIQPKQDKAGVLYSLLGEFAKRDINLTNVESRPTKAIFGEYIFYINLNGHEEDKNVKEALDAIKKENILKVFGSYKKIK